MATITANALIKGFRGKFGNDVVFRSMRGKTFASAPARKSVKKKESEAQRNTRTTFQKATQWAQIILLDAEKKAYYAERARALKLPNAYTAAITDYMRKPKIVKTENRGTVTYRVSKAGFALKEVKAETMKSTDAPATLVTRQKNNTWFVHYTPGEDTAAAITLIVTDSRLRETKFADADFEYIRLQAFTNNYKRL